MNRNPEALLEAIGANVKIHLSGHIHWLDRIEIKDLTMICAISISGGQYDTQEGYGIID